MIEAQAAARVDRLDQDKDIVILRYIVKHSVEEVSMSITTTSLRWRLMIFCVVDKSAAETEIMAG